MKKKRKSLVVFGVVAALLVIAYLGLGFFLGSVVKAGVNSFGPKLTQTAVTLNGAHISPLTGSGSLSGLTVGNPAGFSDNPAFSLGKIHVKVKPFSVLGDYIEIEEILIDEPEFLYETKLVNSNIKQLTKNIESFTGSGGEEPTTKSGEPIKFVVKKFRMTNGTARLGVGPAAVPVPLLPIALDNLGVDEGGITPDELAGEIMESVLGDIVSATGKAALKVGGTVGATATDAAGNAAKKAGEGIKKLFGK
ncbi:MAG: hypothetical protein RIS54_1909 [Verrucomicrobiota bacterium]|jgi:uncharacterized protein involved in outer membrane biogenesis